MKHHFHHLRLEAIVEKYFYRKTIEGHVFPTIFIDEIRTMPTVTKYRMNWGWGEQYDNGVYNTTGDWPINDCNFNIDRKMICDFIDYLDLPLFP